MLCKIREIAVFDVNNSNSDVKHCFLIAAKPIEKGDADGDLSDVEGNGELTSAFVNKGFDIEFRTILFPATTAVESVLLVKTEKYNETLDAYMENKITLEQYREWVEKNMNVVNLESFSVEVTPHFRKFASERDGHKAGDWVIASEGDNFREDDPLKRKLFTKVTVTVLCDSNKTDADGKNVPVESVANKAKKQWERNLKDGEQGFALYNIADEVMKIEKMKASVNVDEGETHGFTPRRQAPKI